MDFQKTKPSKRFKDLTGQDPELNRWLSRQITSQSSLEEEELDLMTSGNWSPRDMYLARTMKYPRNAIIRKDYDHDLQKQDDMIQFLMSYKPGGPKPNRKSDGISRNDIRKPW